LVSDHRCTAGISPYLHKLEKKLKSYPKVLLFPAHIPDMVHFNGFEIDHKAHTIAYGEFVGLEQNVTTEFKCR
jgi:hypothetical protein